jgi:hypothetical protein
MLSAVKSGLFEGDEKKSRNEQCNGIAGLLQAVATGPDSIGYDI